MNDEQMERLLRQGVVLKAPAGLLESLIRDIELPRAASARTDWSTARAPWFKRWLPALSFAAILLTCVAAIATQTNLISVLSGQNETLRATTPPLETLRAENAEYQRLKNENQELDRLRKDNAELQKLRSETARFAAQAQSLSGLRAENQRLQAQASALSTAGPGQTGDFFAEQKARADRVKCTNNLKQIGLAARIWAGDNNGIYPPDFISMTNELSTWTILQCPSGHVVTSWADVAAGNTSYQMLTPGIKESDNPSTVVFECPIHHNICLLDGSVQQLSPEGYQRSVKMVDGRKVFAP